MLCWFKVLQKEGKRGLWSNGVLATPRRSKTGEKIRVRPWEHRELKRFKFEMGRGFGGITNEENLGWGLGHRIGFALCSES